MSGGYILAAIFFVLWQWDAYKDGKKINGMLARVDRMERIVKGVDWGG